MGSKGMFHLDLRDNVLWRYRGADDDARVPLEGDAGLYDCKGPIDALVEAGAGRPFDNNSPAELGARTVEILDAAYRSSKSGRAGAGEDARRGAGVVAAEAPATEATTRGQVTGFFHGGITVSDMDAVAAFYVDGLGLEIEFDRMLDGPYLPVVLGLQFDVIRGVYLRIPGGGFVELLEYHGIERLPGGGPPVRPRGRSPVPLRRRCRSGPRPPGRPGIQGALRARRGHHRRARTPAPGRCYVADPDGYAVELFQKPPAAT